MKLLGEPGTNYLIGAAAAAVALPVATFVAGLPFLVSTVIAVGIFGGVALIASPRRAGERIDPARIGRAQADLVGDLIEQGQPEVDRVRTASSRLKGDRAKQIAHMAEVGQSILRQLENEPERLPVVRRFLTYYLPQASDIAEGLVLLEKQRNPDPTRRARFDEMLGKLDQAFTFYADSFATEELQALDREIKLLGRALDEDLGEASPSRSKETH